MKKKQTLTLINDSGKCVYISCKDGDFLRLSKNSMLTTDEIQIPIIKLYFRPIGSKKEYPFVIKSYDSTYNSYTIIFNNP